MKASLRLRLLLVTAPVLLMGCQALPVAVPPTSAEQQIQLAMDKITESTSMAVNAQRELAMTADAKSQRDISLRKRLLTDIVSYDFYGDVENIVREIATKYGYQFSTYGKRPPEGVITNVFVTKRSVVDVLKQIGVTLNATLDLNVTRDAIELHYKTK